jgi:hypothetical protein
VVVRLMDRVELLEARLVRNFRQGLYFLLKHPCAAREITARFFRVRLMKLEQGRS